MLAPFSPWVDSSETLFIKFSKGSKCQLTIVVASSIMHPIVFPSFPILLSHPILLLPKITIPTKLPVCTP